MSQGRGQHGDVNPNQQCIAHLQAGGLVLTRDRRQARLLRRLHDQQQAAQGLQVWPSAQVMPLEAWVATQWREATFGSSAAELIDPLAAEWLWRRTLPEAAAGLVDAAQLASAARASWLRLRSHRGHTGLLQGRPLTRDQAVFRDWALGVEDGLRSLGQCDADDLQSQWLEAGPAPQPGAPILLAGFRSLTPLQRDFLAQLAASGRLVTTLQGASAPATCFRYLADDPEDELATALGWLRAALLDNPQSQFGLVLPGLAERRAAVERACAAVLQPTLELDSVGSAPCVYELAGGTALSSSPVVAAALSMLACSPWRVAFSDVSQLLRSRCLAVGTDRNACLRLDLELRRNEPPQFWQRDALANRLRQAVPELAAAFDAAARCLEGPGRRSPSDWALALGQALAAWGWPGEGAKASGEFQRHRPCVNGCSRSAGWMPWPASCQCRKFLPNCAGCWRHRSSLSGESRRSTCSTRWNRPCPGWMGCG